MSYQALFTLVFFVAFIAMTLWVYRPSRKKDYENSHTWPLRLIAVKRGMSNE